MATGKVISFDETRGFGFVAPDVGGEDVFVHVNDLDFDKRLLSLGGMVEFEVEEGQRGLKAAHVRMANPAEPESLPVLDVKPAKPADPLSDDEVCDVLTMKEYLDEITEMLLTTMPTLTAQHIVHIRQQAAQLACAHGWVEQ